MAKSNKNVGNDAAEEVVPQVDEKVKLKGYVAALYNAASLSPLPKKDHDALLQFAVAVTRFIENDERGNA